MPAGLSRLLDKAMRRWLLNRFVLLAAVWLTVAGGLALLVRIAERLLPFTVDWMVAGIAAAAAAVVIAGAHAWFGKPTRVGLAGIVDERAGLRETLSTAVVMSSRPDPWSQAAVGYAEDSARRVVLRDVMPMRVPGLLGVPLALGLVVGLLGLTPRVDLIERLASGRTATPDVGSEAEILEARADVERTTEELRKAMESVESDELRQALEELLSPREELRDPDDIRREAMKKMDELEERLSGLADDAMAQTLSEMTQRMQRFDEKGMEDLKGLLDALKRGDFQQAQQEFEKLAQKMNDPNLSEEERERLAEQLEKLAEMMREAAAQNEALAEKLREAGVDPGLMNSLEQLREALEQAGLSQEQVEQIMKEAQQNQQTQQQLEKMAGNCQQCAGGMQQSQSGQQNQQGQQGQQGMSQQLQQMAASQEQREAAMQAMRMLAESKQQLGQCMGGDEMAMWMLPPKFAQQNSGQQAGSSWMRNDTGTEVDESAYQIADQLRAPSQQGDGPILSSELFYGDQIVGESKQEFREAVGRASQAANDAVSNTRVPREYHEVIRRYFGELEKRAEQEEKPAS